MRLTIPIKIDQHQVWFILLQGIAAIGSILAGKVIATYFQPAEFGRYFLATSLVALYAAVFTNPVIQSYRHLFFRKKNINLFTYYRSFFFWQALLLVVLLFIVGWVGITAAGVLVLVFLQIVLSNNSSLQMSNINIQGHTTLQSTIQAISPFINMALLLSLVFLGGRNDFMGIWWALVLVELAVVLLTVFYFKANRITEILPLRLVFDPETLGMIIRFAKPLVFLPVFAWIVNNLDRYLLDLFYSKNEVGIYSAAYGLGSKIFLMGGGALVAYLNTSVYKQMTDISNYPAMYKITMRRIVIYIVTGSIVVIGLYLFSETIGIVLLSEGYRAAFALIPLLGLANLFFTALFIPEQVLYAMGKTKYILFHYAIGAVANLLLNILLIPGYSVWGAGLAMVLSSLIQLAYLIFLFRKAMRGKMQQE